jgi:hypothetical protein
MKTFTFCTAIALATAGLGITSLATAEEKPTTEKVKETASDAVEATKEGAKRAAHTVAATTRQAWKKTKAYLSQEPTTYRQGASGQLNELKKEINQLKEVNAGDRDYFATRIHSLEQQHQYAEDQLAGLAVEDMKAAKESKRSRLNRTIDRLEDNIALAQKEANDFAPAQ